MSHLPQRFRVVYGFAAALALSTGSLLVHAEPVSELSKVPAMVSITAGSRAATTIVLETRAVAVKETGPTATVAKFGEVYAFSPAFFVVREDKPTAIQIWNLQPDDAHDFELLGPRAQELVDIAVPPLVKKSYVFDFHKPGLYTFKCTIHQPEMNGQILVLSATHG